MKGKEKIKVIVAEPGKPGELREIPNTLEAMQELVDGYIETVTITKDLVLICNEDGRLVGLPERVVCGIPWAGTVILAGRNEDEFDDVPRIVIDNPQMWEEP